MAGSWLANALGLPDVGPDDIDKFDLPDVATPQWMRNESTFNPGSNPDIGYINQDGPERGWDQRISRTPMPYNINAEAMATGELQPVENAAAGPGAQGYSTPSAAGWSLGNPQMNMPRQSPFGGPQIPPSPAQTPRERISADQGPQSPTNWLTQNVVMPGLSFLGQGLGDQLGLSREAGPSSAPAPPPSMAPSVQQPPDVRSMAMSGARSAARKYVQPAPKLAQEPTFPEAPIEHLSITSDVPVEQLRGHGFGRTWNVPKEGGAFSGTNSFSSPDIDKRLAMESLQDQTALAKQQQELEQAQLPPSAFLRYQDPVRQKIQGALAVVGPRELYKDHQEWLTAMLSVLNGLGSRYDQNAIGGYLPPTNP